MGVRTWADWQPREFKPTMCTDLIELMEVGKGPEAFNAKYNIGRQHFYKWLAAYPDLKLAYEIGKEKAKQYLVNVLHDNMFDEQNSQEPTEKFNIAVWREIMKHSFQIPEQREANRELANINKQPEVPLRTMMTTVLDGLRCGMYGTEEAQALANLIETAQRVTETAELTKRIEEIELALKGGSTVEEFKEEDEPSSSGVECTE